MSSSTYEIIDVRSTDAKPISNDSNDNDNALASSNGDADRAALKDSILAGLTAQTKSIPTLVLYDDRGLQLFDQITYLDEYYLTNAEMDILNTKADQIVKDVKDSSVVIELGAGALRKTSIILDALERNKKDITYYALDLMLPELQKSLGSLGTYSNIKLKGLLGTYDQGLDFLGKLSKHIPKMYLWLGSSIGNFNRKEASLFLQKYRSDAMNVGDLFLIGIDRRNDSEKVRVAYNDSKGVTEEFIMNGMDHVQRILGSNVIDRANFEYDAGYNDVEGRHEAYYRSKRHQSLTIDDKVISIKSGERLHIEYSYKYSSKEVTELFDSAKLSRVETWADSKQQYDLHLVSKAPFYQSMAKADGSVDSLLPSLSDWDDLWAAWDTVTLTMIPKEMLLEKPIDLRHPCIFYIGHIPTFLDIILSRHLKEPYTEPSRYAEIFERGIDPDLEDPNICHDHSEVPDEWPDLEDILAFRDRVRARLRSLYSTNVSRRLGRVINMGFEHEIMHMETLLYMLIQSPKTRAPAGIAAPIWEAIAPPKGSTLKPAAFLQFPKSHLRFGSVDDEDRDDESPAQTEQYTWDNERPPVSVDVPAFSIASRPITNGEYLDYLQKTVSKDFPPLWVAIDSAKFEYNIRTVWSNSALANESEPNVVSMAVARDWPVMASAKQLEEYAQWAGGRLPREEELRVLYERIYKDDKGLLNANVGFQRWHAMPVGELQGSTIPAYEIAKVNIDGVSVDGIGSAWEWTSTDFAAHKGYKKSELYPGYSSDFFDGKHNVCIGSSWATHPRFAGRWRTVRNWYNRGYGYCWATARMVRERS